MGVTLEPLITEKDDAEEFVRPTSSDLPDDPVSACIYGDNGRVARNPRCIIEI